MLRESIIVASESGSKIKQFGKISESKSKKSLFIILWCVIFDFNTHIHTQNLMNVLAKGERKLGSQRTLKVKLTKLEILEGSIYM